MKRRSRGKSAATYRLHKASGQAVVTINGRIHDLGKFDTERLTLAQSCLIH